MVRAGGRLLSVFLPTLSFLAFFFYFPDERATAVAVAVTMRMAEAVACAFPFSFLLHSVCVRLDGRENVDLVQMVQSEGFVFLLFAFCFCSSIRVVATKGRHTIFLLA